jgi:hypothetical protein
MMEQHDLCPNYHKPRRPSTTAQVLVFCTCLVIAGGEPFGLYFEMNGDHPQTNFAIVHYQSSDQSPDDEGHSEPNRDPVPRAMTQTSSTVQLSGRVMTMTSGRRTIT